MQAVAGAQRGARFDGEVAVMARQPREWSRELPAPSVSFTAGASRIKSMEPAQPLKPTAVGKAAGYDARYQCAPGERPYGAGFAAEWQRLRGQA